MDAPSFYHRWCNCEGCRKLYRETYSEELPDSPPEDGASEWGRIGSMRINRKYAIMNALHKVTQKHGIPLILNVRGHCRAGNGDPVLEIAAADGTNSGEGYRPKANFWSMATLWRMGEAFRKVQYGYCPTGTFYNMRSYSSDEGVVVGMSEAMFSMTPFLESATSYLFDKTGSDTLKTVCQNIEEHREMYYRTVPINDIAVVSDGKAINYLTSKECKNLYMDYQGCIEALTLENRHFECMYDRQISRERIKGYRAVYLPLTSFVPPKTREVLEEYVRSGGTVICGPDFSRRNADMQEIDFYEMSNFLGVDFTRKNDRSLIDIHQREYRESACVFPYAAIPEAYVRVEKDMPGMKASSTPVIPVSDTVVRLDDDPYLEYTIANPHPDTEVLASLYLPAGGTRGEPLEFPDGTPPAVTRHKFGNGYVYWLAIRPGLAFIKNPRFDIPHLIRAICDMPGEGPAVQFDTAGAVLCFLVENGKGTAWLHLSSYTGAMLERSMAPERIVPLSNIPFKIRCSALPFDVDEKLCIVTEYGEEKLPWHLESNYVCFTLPELKLYQSLRFFKK